jgi:hypothetical protein
MLRIGQVLWSNLRLIYFRISHTSSVRQRNNTVPQDLVRANFYAHSSHHSQDMDRNKMIKQEVKNSIFKNDGSHGTKKDFGCGKSSPCPGRAFITYLHLTLPQTKTSRLTHQAIEFPLLSLCIPSRRSLVHISARYAIVVSQGWNM